MNTSKIDNLLNNLLEYEGQFITIDKSVLIDYLLDVRAIDIKLPNENELTDIKDIIKQLDMQRQSLMCKIEENQKIIDQYVIDSKTTSLSGSYLMDNGWIRKASTYTKGGNLITYDGCNWYLNDKRIFTINEIP